MIRKRDDVARVRALAFATDPFMVAQFEPVFSRLRAAMQPIDSPCTKVCTLHPRMQICTGCGRNLSEIERWAVLSSVERTQLINVVRKRLDDLQARDWRETP